MTRDFAAALEDNGVAESPLGAVQGRGAFRRFKELVHDAGLAGRWQTFREGRFRQIALD